MESQRTLETFLFCFGYESPEEWRSNERHGTDFESSSAVWVEAESPDEATEAGLEFAQSWVAGLFREAGVADFPGWQESDYAYWIEEDHPKHSGDFSVDDIPRIRA